MPLLPAYFTFFFFPVSWILHRETHHQPHRRKLKYDELKQSQLIMSFSACCRPVCRFACSSSSSSLLKGHQNNSMLPVPVNGEEWLYVRALGLLLVGFKTRWFLDLLGRVWWMWECFVFVAILTNRSVLRRFFSLLLFFFWTSTVHAESLVWSNWTWTATTRCLPLLLQSNPVVSKRFPLQAKLKVVFFFQT